MNKGAVRRDRRKYFDYHKDNSHDTEECIHLREKIEDLICKGTWKTLLKDKDNGEESWRKITRVKVITIGIQTASKEETKEMK